MHNNLSIYQSQKLEPLQNFQVRVMTMDTSVGQHAVECMTFSRNLCPQSTKLTTLYCPIQTCPALSKGHNPPISVRIGQKGMRK